jgi:flagellar basal body-associated protein FliL
MSKNKDHLKFTLFPFVSILLAVVGVLLFLTMVQSVLLKGDDKKESQKKKSEENTRVYERIPELNTNVLTISSDAFELKKADGTTTTYSESDFPLLQSEIYKSLLKVNFDRSEKEISMREHLLFVVDNGGAKNYFYFLEAFKFNSTIKTYLPTGLVLLNPGERFKLK